jgi:Tfp pilus assembly protein PilF
MRGNRTRYRSLVVVVLAIVGVATALDDAAAHRTLRPVQTGPPPDPVDLIHDGDWCLCHDDNVGALAHFNAAIRIDPRNVRAYLKRGSLRSDMRDRDGAVADFNAALRIDPACARASGDRRTGDARTARDSRKGE